MNKYYVYVDDVKDCDYIGDIKKAHYNFIDLCYAYEVLDFLYRKVMLAKKLGVRYKIILDLNHDSDNYVQDGGDYINILNEIEKNDDWHTYIDLSLIKRHS